MTVEQAARPKPPPSRWVALVILCTGMLMIILDQTIVNVALPAIQDDLGFSQSSLAWVVNAYLIAFGGLLLLAGRLGDLIGRRRMFVAGLGVFTVASLLCGLANRAAVLVIARFVQGAGGAMTSAVILGMIVTLFPERHEQAKAIGVFSFVAAAGGAIGLLAGGILTQSLNWHWIFFVNVPVGAVAAFLALRVLEPEKGAGWAGGADVLGAVLVTSSLMLSVFTIVQAADVGWLSVPTIGLGLVAVGLMIGFVVRQHTATNPLLPLRLFESRDLSGANAVIVLMLAGLFGFFFLGTLYLQKVLGFDAVEIGLAFVPVTVVVGALSLGASARLNTRFGAARVLLPALALIAVGLALLTRSPVDGHFVADVLPATLFVGTGVGLAIPALTTLAMSGATTSDSGVVSGVFNTTQQVGGALGLAVLATLATTRSDRLLAEGEPRAIALTSGYHLAFTLATGFIVVALVVAVVVLRPLRPLALGHRGDGSVIEPPTATLEVGGPVTLVCAVPAADHLTVDAELELGGSSG